MTDMGCNVCFTRMNKFWSMSSGIGLLLDAIINPRLFYELQRSISFKNTLNPLLVFLLEGIDNIFYNILPQDDTFYSHTNFLSI